MVDAGLRSQVVPVGEVVAATEHPWLEKMRGQVYEGSLAELVSQVVSSDPDEFKGLLYALEKNPELSTLIGKKLNIKNWEKALYDEANYQFTDRRRAMAEVIFNAGDSITRQANKEGKTREDRLANPPVVTTVIEDGLFEVSDDGEGMDLKTIVTKLLIPKITGNTDLTDQTTGRFGVGFYSLLNYLNEPNSSITIKSKTRDAKAGVSVTLTRVATADGFQNGRYQVSIKPLTDIEQAQLTAEQVKTKVTVQSAAIQATEIEDYLSNVLQDLPESRAKVKVRSRGNEKELNNTSHLKEHVFSVGRFLYSPEVGEQCRVRIDVGGVLVEEIEVAGFQIPKQLVFDLPLTTELPKSRDKVELNEAVATAFNDLLALIFQIPMEQQQKAQLLNGLAEAVKILQSRNKLVKNNLQLDKSFRRLAMHWVLDLPPEMTLLPNGHELAAVNLTNVLSLNQELIPFNVRVKDRTIQEVDGVKIIKVPFQEPTRALAVCGDVILLNEKIDDNDPHMRPVLSALLDVYNLAVDDDLKIKNPYKLSRTVTSPESDQKRPKLEYQPAQTSAGDVSPFGEAMSAGTGRAGGEYRRRRSEEAADSKARKERLAHFIETYRSMPGQLRVHVARVRGEQIIEPEQVMSYGEYLEQVRTEQAKKEETGRGRLKAFNQMDNILRGMGRKGVNRSDDGPDYRIEIAAEFETVEKLQLFYVKKVITDVVATMGEDIEPYSSILTPLKLGADVDLVSQVVTDTTANECLRFFLDMRGANQFEQTQKIAQKVGLSAELTSEWTSYVQGRRNKNNVKESEATREFIITQFRNQSHSDSDKVKLATFGLWCQVLTALNEAVVVLTDTELLRHIVRSGELGKLIAERRIRVDLSLFNAEKVNVEPDDELARETNMLSNIFDTHFFAAIFNTPRTLRMLNSPQATAENKVRFLKWFIQYDRQKEIDIEAYKAKFTRSEEPSLFTDQEPTVESLTVEISRSGMTHDKLRMEALYAGIAEPAVRAAIDQNQHIFVELYMDPEIRQYLFKERLSTSQYVIIEMVRSLADPVHILTKPLHKENVVKLVKTAMAEQISANSDWLRVMIALTSYPPEVFDQYLQLALQERQILYTNKLSSFRSMVIIENETPEMVKERITVFKDMPAEFLQSFLQIQDLLINVQPGTKLAEYRDQTGETHKKLLNVFQDILKRPAPQVKELIKQLSRAVDDMSAGKVDWGVYSTEVRAYLDFLSGLSQGISTDSVEINPDRAVNVQASHLVANYLSQEKQDSAALLEVFKTTAKGDVLPALSRELGQRRIEHAVNYQGIESFNWLRELVQNTYNATRGQENPFADVKAFAKDDQLTVSVEDNVGMTLQQVLNNLLIPQVSDWESAEAIGYYGHGFFSIFKEASEVNIKTSIGDGHVIYLRCVPVRKDGKVVDIQYQIEQRDEEYKGTKIVWQKASDTAALELAKVKEELIETTSLMPRADLNVKFNETTINSDQPVAGQAESPLGRVRVFTIRGANRLTQNGLGLRIIDKSIADKLPVICQKAITQFGLVIDIPPQIKLTDGRTDIAQKETIWPQLETAVLIATMQATIKLFAEGKMKLAELPYDFFEDMQRYLVENPDVEADVKLLESGQTDTIDWTKYSTNQAKFIKLLFSIPSIELNGRTVSFVECIEVVKTDPTQLERLPDVLRNVIVQAVSAQDQKTEKNQVASALKTQEVRWEELPSGTEIYQAWTQMYQHLLSKVSERRQASVGHGWVGSVGAIAYYRPVGNIIAWDFMANTEAIRQLQDVVLGNRTMDTAQQFVYRLVETGSHEYQHRVENRGENMTHNRQFYEGQRQILEEMVLDVDWNQAERIIGEYQPRVTADALLSPEQLYEQLKQT